MVKNIIYSVVFLFVGTFIGWVGHCTYQGKESVIERNVVRFDTIVKEVKVKVPERKIVYISKTDTLLKNITNERLITEYCTDTITEMVATNLYEDSIFTNDFRFDYQIQTLGDLIKFDPKFIIYPRPCPTYKKPKWSVVGGISNRGNFKFGVGYKGWLTEIEMKENFNQVFFGYQYNF